ncbi:hypothetical protein C8R44DRAFT_334566 [Mycena epipterygia]|nr:hypothetical protein C8R44DRAFT_334566 [Mycena epipterygia]
MCTLVEIGAVHGPHPLDTGYASTPGYVWARRWTRFAKREEERAEENGGRIECYDTVRRHSLASSPDLTSSPPSSPRPATGMSLRHRHALGDNASARASAPTADLEADARCGTVPLPTSTSRYGLCLFRALRVPAHIHVAGPPNPPLPRPARTPSSAPAIVWHPGERTGPPYAQVERTAVRPRMHPLQPHLLPTANDVRDADAGGKTQRRARPARRTNLARVPRYVSPAARLPLLHRPPPPPRHPA